jgi:CBS domain-containing protein
MGEGQKSLAPIAARAPSDLHERLPGLFSPFEVLFEIVRQARNDAMHTGAYARRATAKALELCLVLEDGLMATGGRGMRKVKDYMVREPTTVKEWAPLAKVRQLMLLHSFSNVPVFIERERTWYLVNELEVARFLRGSRAERDLRLGMTVERAFIGGLRRRKAIEITPNQDVNAVLGQENENGGASLWLVVDEHRQLLGVLTPFELM